MADAAKDAVAAARQTVATCRAEVDRLKSVVGSLQRLEQARVGVTEAEQRHAHATATLANLDGGTDDAADDFEDEVNALDEQLRDVSTSLTAASTRVGTTAGAAARAQQALAANPDDVVAMGAVESTAEDHAAAKEAAAALQEELTTLTNARQKLAGQGLETVLRAKAEVEDAEDDVARHTTMLKVRGVAPHLVPMGGLPRVEGGMHAWDACSGVAMG